MAYFWKMPLTQDELQEGQSEDQASYSMYHFNPDSQVSLGLDQIVGEGSSEIPFYGPAYSHDPKENEFFLDAAEEHLYRINPPQIPHRDLYFGSPTSHWQQVRVPPTIGFRPSLLSGCSDLSENSYPTYPIGTLYDYGPYGRNNLSPTADEFGSDVEKENKNLNVCIGFEHIDYQYPVFSDNNASGQGMQDKRRNDSKSFLVSTGETYLTNPPRELTTGPVWPSISANSSADSTELAGWSIQLVEADQGSNESIASFCNGVQKIRDAYPAFDLTTNTGKIWSVTTTLSDEILCKSKFKVSILTNCSSPPLHLTPCASCIVRNFVVEILHCTNQYPAQEECFLSVYGSDEFLQNDYALGSHESLRKATTSIQLRLQKGTSYQQSLARTLEDDQSQFNVNQLLQYTYIWKVSRKNLVTFIMKYGGQVEYLLQNEHKVDKVIEEAKAICSVLCSVETRAITDAVKKLHSVPLGKTQNSLQNVETPVKVLIENAVTELSAAISHLIHVFSSSFHTDFQPAKILRSPSCADVDLDPHFSFTVYAAHNIPTAWLKSYKLFSFSCSLTYAGKKICQVKNCKNIPVKKSFFFLANWNEKINFPLQIKSLPNETILIIKLFGVNCVSKNTEILAWTCFPLYQKQKFIHGTVLLSMALYSEPPTTMIAPGICDTSLPALVTLQVDFPETNLEFIKPEPEEKRDDLEEPAKECLKHVARLSQKQSLLLLLEQERRFLWFYRSYCNNENCSLSLVLGSAPSWDRKSISEMYTVLREWSFSNPLEALGLLTFSFPDQDIRRTAVQQMENLSNDELLEYLPQLVQVIKFEWSLESPLVKLLLCRSLQSIQVTHQLYWLLKDAQNEAHFKSWYQKLLAAVQFCAGKTLNDEFSKERKLIKILGDVAEKVKAASDPKKQEVLKMEINKFKQFFQEVNVCRLPLNPALVVQGIDADACSYFTSNAFPLKISFINTETLSRNINVIFKVGDDLRQDMLVLQIIRVMDRIWLQEGLDMQMIIYKCLSTGKGQGLVQMVSDATTLAKIHRESGLIGPLKENTIKKWFSHHHPVESSYQEAIKNFFHSCAGWCVVTFILGVCDRHNDNIMLTNTGHMFHIDFGKILGHAQKFGSIKRDRAPFIFTSEMEYFITEGGKTPQRFQEFVELCCRAYNIVRKHSQLLLNLLEMMLHAGLPELNSVQDLKYVYDNLRPQDSDLQATSHFTRKIKESLECFPVKLNNLIHTLAQMLATGFAKSTASQSVPRESNMLDAERSIARATILGFSKKPDSLYLVQVVQTCQVVTFVEKSFEQFSKLHSHLQKQFPSHTLPEFPHWWHLPFTDLEHKRMKDLNLYVKQLLNGSSNLSNNEHVLSFFLDGSKTDWPEESVLVSLGPKSTEQKPGVQLVISYESTHLTILLKHMRNIILMKSAEGKRKQFQKALTLLIMKL
ncbi:phosphatidylinositol 3-kinase C2 domain-containing subunit gamma isoform X2 [Malaclemys terrapin pileata]|uniref:phosphatidylinositol 3-kinase C2 domain-containing subunit gamma isoform X2 n=1 Tax=Malaclemys terrapin pileata TaxID=2991368 RepID=UPI0023A871B2|nr:phosphatidylinositol 3-kinase C2 domain-containing subunit gamma isoform X2 [Malaclemys terrapin pileata]